MEKTISVVVVTYNVKELTFDCLASLRTAEDEMEKNGFTMEVIISDNGSSDGTIEMVKTEFPSVKLIENNENLGFSKGNNRARTIVVGKYVLMLNPDTIVEKNTLPECVRFLEVRPEVGALTCRIDLWNGGTDKDARRAFPTPWVALTHFSGLDKVFPRSEFFAGYWYGSIPEDREHEVDVLQGAFCLVRRDVLEKVGWYDEDYFLDGEDIDLCWKIKRAGYKIIYFPKVRIVHYKGASKGKERMEFANKRLDAVSRRRFIVSGVDSMKIFYRKHLSNRYPFFISLLVFFGIDLIKFLRLVRYDLKSSFESV